jgi:hypothetical protein
MALPSLNRIAEILGGRVSGNEVIAPGPGHSAADASMSIKVDAAAPDGFVVHSFAGDDDIACKDYVRKKLGIERERPRKANGDAKPFSPTVARYTYRAANGTPYLQVQRTAAKDFYQHHWDGEKWLKGAPDGQKIPYCLPELLAGPSTAPVYICEGEKDCDNLAKLGFVATCNSEGADTGTGKKWTPDLNQYFKDRTVYVLADNDDKGHKHAQHVARNLDSVAASVRVVELPDLPPKGDVSDWLKRDTAGVKLTQLCQAAPLWESESLRSSTSWCRPSAPSPTVSRAVRYHFLSPSCGVRAHIAQASTPRAARSRCRCRFQFRSDARISRRSAAALRSGDWPGRHPGPPLGRLQKREADHSEPARAGAAAGERSQARAAAPGKARARTTHHRGGRAALSVGATGKRPPGRAGSNAATGPGAMTAADRTRVLRQRAAAVARCESRKKAGLAVLRIEDVS